MVFRFLIRFLLSDKVIDKLAESYPIRQAARWAVYVIHRTKAIKGDNSINLKEKNLKIFKEVAIRLSHFFKRIQSIKPTKPANEGKSFHDQTVYRSARTEFAEKSNKSKEPSVDKNSPIVDANGDAKEKLRKYVEELRRRTKT